MTDGAQIMSNTNSSGTCGNIKVKANSILLSGVDTGGNQTAISSSVVSELATGAGGDIKIKAQTLEVKEGAIIASATIGPGDAGKIEVNAESVLISGKTKDGYTSSLITSSASSGKAGDIQIKTHNLEINDDGYIDASTYVSENAGNISIKAPWITLANGGSISAGTTGSGTGGSIQLSGNQIQLINGALIHTASVEGATGNAGDIDISAENTLQMKNSFISTVAGQSDGGNIQIKAGYMVELIDSKIVASVKGGRQTTGGNITIDPQYVILNDSQINSKATEGNGGKIHINADVFLASPQSKVDAHSERGISGTVDIRAPITNISGTLVPMQGNFLSAEALLRDRCAAKIRGEKYSSFVVSGRDGLPIRPGSVLPSPIY
jgi:large exoprotein involved in heme utilization and adhesion